MLKPERIVLAIFGSTSVLTALVLVVLVLAAGKLASDQAAPPGRAKRPFRAAGAASFAAFLAGVACAALSVWYLLQQHHAVYLAVVGAFALQLALLTLTAGQVFTQVMFNSRLRSQRGSDVSLRSGR